MRCSLYTKQFNFEGIQFTSENVKREKNNGIRSLTVGAVYIAS